MSDKFANRQREIQQARKGRPVLSLEFDVFDDGEVAMWAHTRHEIPFAQMQRAFEAIQDHLSRFIADGDMCPFNPAFVKSLPVVEDEAAALSADRPVDNGASCGESWRSRN